MLSHSSSTFLFSPSLARPHLFHARRLAALASQLVRQRQSRLRLRRLLEFRIKRGRIALQNLPHGFLPLLFVADGIVARQTAARGSAVQLHAKALAVQFQAARLFARASHNLHFGLVRGFNFAGTRGARSVLQSGRGWIHGDCGRVNGCGLTRCRVLQGLELFLGRGRMLVALLRSANTNTTKTATTTTSRVG